MTLLVTIFAAIVSTLVWYINDNRKTYCLGFLTLMYWGASLMWFVDAVYEYIELGADYFTPTAAEMINDTFLGISVIALGLIIWLVIFLVKDPKGVIKQVLTR